MLLLLSILKLVFEIALMSLIGQWVLGLLAGAKRDTNIFYQLLALLGKPFVLLARVVTPRSIVLERHLPLVAFLMTAFGWIVVTALRIQHCLQIGVELCK